MKYFSSIILAAVGLSSSMSFAADQVTQLSDGRTVRGTFQSITADAIQIKRTNGESVRLRPDEVKNVRFNREPNVLQRIRTNVRNQSWQTALTALETLKDDYTGGDRRVVAEMAFLHARCLAGLAHADSDRAPPAIAALEEFLASYSNHYRRQQTEIVLAELLLERDPSRAMELLEGVRSSPATGFALQAGMTMGRALLDHGDPDQAMLIFEDAIRQSADDAATADVHFESRIGQAECLRRQSQPGKALDTLTEVISEAPEDPPTILARAWLKSGDCQLNLGEQKAALMAYLHVDVLYPSSSAEHAESLYRLMALWQTVGKPDRAQEAETRLQTLYPQSRWAHLAVR